MHITEELAEQAQAALDNPALQKAMALLRDEAMQAFRNSKLGDADALEEAHRDWWAVQRLEKKLQRLTKPSSSKERET